MKCKTCEGTGAMVNPNPPKGWQVQGVTCTACNGSGKRTKTDAMGRKIANVQTKPEYRESNPKIDLYILTDAGSLKYYGSTNYWRTVRDCLNFYNRSSGHNGLLFVKGEIDRRARS